MTSFISMNEKEVLYLPWVPLKGVIPSGHFIEAMSILESHSNDSKIHHRFLSEEEKQSIMLENALFQGFWENEDNVSSESIEVVVLRKKQKG